MRGYLYFGLILLAIMCIQTNRGARGGAIRRITRLITNRPDLSGMNRILSNENRTLIDLTPSHNNGYMRPLPLHGDTHLESKHKQKSAVSESEHGLRENLTTINCNGFVSKYENFSIGLLNCQSIKNKTDHIFDTIYDNKFSMMFLTETWIQMNGDDPHLGHSTPNGYHSIHRSRTTGKRGGGVGVILQDCIKTVDNTSAFKTYDSFELLAIESIQNGSPVRYYLIERPPPSAKKRYHIITIYD